MSRLRTIRRCRPFRRLWRRLRRRFGAGPGRRVSATALQSSDGLPDLAVVVFSGRATLAWLRLLRPGFRHCYVLLRSGGDWIYYDPMGNFTLAAVVGPRGVLAILRFFRDLGDRPLLYRPVLPPGPRSLAWRPYTCVEAVKRVLGLNAPWVVTPWQLYRCLMARQALDGALPAGRRRRPGGIRTKHDTL